AGLETEFTISGPRQPIPTPSEKTAAPAAESTADRDSGGLRALSLAPSGTQMDLSALDLGLAPVLPSCVTYSNCYWNLLGNGNIPAGVNFLGTVAGELDPLEFRVNNNRAMLYTFSAANTAPNITGGFLGNVVTGLGGTIAGGGQLGSVNRIDAPFGTVSG